MSAGNNTKTASSQININADQIEEFVMTQLKEYLKGENFKKIAEEIAAQIGSASHDLHKEKKELLDIKTQIQNGMKAVLYGMDIPELRDEIDRLRVRKSELEDIIAQAQSGNKNIDPEQLEAYLSGLVSKLDKTPEAVLKHNKNNIRL